MHNHLSDQALCRKFFLIGGAGFIGSHFTEYLMKDSRVQKLTIYDNFSSGRKWHIEPFLQDHRFQVVENDVKNFPSLVEAMAGHDTIIHFASNPDIARAATEPDIDFREGTALTNNVVEAMRITKAKKILYTSGSGVYGDLHHTEAHEDWGPMIPASTYGASKLAGEALISSYCYMFDMQACIFRFGNVVGPRQTHGVGYDFAKRLLENPQQLRILGDGTQSKSYIYVEDIINAVLMAHDKAHLNNPNPVSYFNVATGDYITVNEIADVTLNCLNIPKSSVQIEYTGGNRGWKGDVPIVRLNTNRIRKLGWQNSRNCAEAIRDSVTSMIKDIKLGKI